MPFPFTSLLDNFNRADEDPLGNGNWSGPIWVGDNRSRIVSNQCVEQSGVQYSDSYWSATQFTDTEQYLTVVTIGSSTPYLQLYTRIANPNSSADAYFLEFVPSNTITINRLDGESATQLGASITQTVSAGDRLGFASIGPNHTVYLDTGSGWTAIGTRSDATYSTGFLGHSFGQDNWVIDDVSGGQPLFTSSDVTAVGLIESTAIMDTLLSFSSVAATAVGVMESAVIVTTGPVSVMASDSMTLGMGESTSATITVQGSESSVPVGVLEAPLNAVTGTLSDTLGVGVVDARLIHSLFVFSDAVATGMTESGQITVLAVSVITASDTWPCGVIEDRVIFSTGVSEGESLTVSVSESGVIATDDVLPIVVSLPLSLGVSESISVVTVGEQAMITASDVMALQVSESFHIQYTSFKDFSESLSLGWVEVAQALELGGFLFFSGFEDPFSIGILDVAHLTNAIPDLTPDTVAVGVTESSALIIVGSTATVTASDTWNVGTSEAAAVQGLAPGAGTETWAVGLVESGTAVAIGITAPLVATDTFTCGLLELTAASELVSFSASDSWTVATGVEAGSHEELVIGLNTPFTTYEWLGAIEPGGTEALLTTYEWLGAIEPQDVLKPAEWFVVETVASGLAESVKLVEMRLAVPYLPGIRAEWRGAVQLGSYNDEASPDSRFLLQKI